ncbi:MAG: hypothetical protein ACC652_07840, partial [Acidimicrobiales bacterium]
MTDPSAQGRNNAAPPVWARRAGAAVLFVVVVAASGLLIGVTYKELTKDTSGTEVATGAPGSEDGETATTSDGG